MEQRKRIIKNPDEMELEESAKSRCGHFATEFNRHLQQMNTLGLNQWISDLLEISRRRLTPENHGTLPQWVDALAALPSHGEIRLDPDSDRVIAEGQTESPEKLSEILMAFHPWRKGPFEVLGIEIDTEWRSNWKWDRIRHKVELRGKRVLDVGCGNGYYGWRMLAEGAESVVGVEPFLLYLMQFEVLRRFAPDDIAHWVLPLGDAEIPNNLRAFDTAFSMGVLYHRSSPIDHLQKMASTLKPGGELVLETIVIDSPDPTTLVPSGRYAKMRNVWFLPSVSMLEIWLERCGFTNIETLDITRTSTQEQRRTSWMTFESLSDFLDPNDSTRTIEGYPAPVRAILKARRR